MNVNLVIRERGTQLVDHTYLGRGGLELFMVARFNSNLLEHWHSENCRLNSTRKKVSS